MPNIARTKSRPVARAAAAPKTKILLVRQPVKSVRRSDEPDRPLYRLMLGVVVSLGAVASVWIMGFLGFRLGFAPMLRVPELVIEPVDALAVGTLTVISIPMHILQAGLAEPLALMIGFVLIAIPAASLGAIQPTAPGGPRPKLASVTLSYLGAIAACLNALGLLWWMMSPYRLARFADLPMDYAMARGSGDADSIILHAPAMADTWLAKLQFAAGLDVLAAAAAALWVVVVMRLGIPRWLGSLGTTICIFTLVVIFVAMSMSNVSASQVTAGRSLFHTAETAAQEELVLGFTPQYFVTLRAHGHAVFVDLRDRPENFTAVGKQSILEYLKSHEPAE
jgi:hypothetical protein